MSVPPKVMWLMALFLVLGVAGLSTALVLAFQEPSYQGRSLSQWLMEFNRIPPEKPAPEAERAIQHIGARAVPYLLANIWSGEPRQQTAARKWVNRTLHKSYRSRIDLCAPSWRALSILGPAAASALPEISRHAAQGPFSGRARIALAALGTNSIPALTALCGESDPDVRMGAAFLLAKSTVNMRGLESFIAVSPFSDQPMLAYNIKEGVEDLPQLLPNLHHNQPTVRRATAEAIGSDARMSRLARRDIQQCLQDPDPGVREVATNTLKKVSATSAQATQ